MNRWSPAYRQLERKPKGAKKVQAAPPLILSLSFLAVIIIGTLLLKLPIMTTQPITWVQSLFTATSAVTVTGLVVVDTGSAFTLAGQTVIAILIQLGGLGLMTFAVVTLIALGNKMSFMQQSAVKEAFNQTDMSTLVSTAKAVLLFAFVVESVGFIVLTAFWWQELPPLDAMFHAFFYTISAFNNAGFALSSDSLSAYVASPVVNITITLLFIVGGLGFSVWLELLKKRRWQPLSVYARAMILGTVVINVLAFVLILLIEGDNPATLAGMDTQAALWASWFQAVTTRTA
ncbi:MAG: potassium transporter TrkG, partial [Pseudomonadota bacterium]|nr:potassium transporter TrkG [Pseudomonadota bacterium]